MSRTLSVANNGANNGVTDSERTIMCVRISPLSPIDPHGARGVTALPNPDGANVTHYLTLNPLPGLPACSTRRGTTEQQAGASIQQLRRGTALGTEGG